MSIIKIFLFMFILSVTVIDSRALRKRRQTASNSLGQTVNGYLSYGLNTIRDNVVPAIGSTVDRFSQNWDKYKQGFNQGINQVGQNWDQYKQNFNQGINQIGQNWDQYKQNFNQGINQFSQGWNQFSQNAIPQYPYNNNYGYNPYGYNAQQNVYPMNYNSPQNVYRNYDGRPGYQYPANNYYNSYGSPQGNIPYYRNNPSGQWYQNFGGQPRSGGAIAPNTNMYANQRVGSRRK